MRKPKLLPPTEAKAFSNWLNTFLEEKGIDPEVIEFEIMHNDTWHYMPLMVVLEYILDQPAEIQEQIQTKIVQIDFLNGKVEDFFKYIAKGIISFHATNF